MYICYIFREHVKPAFGHSLTLNNMLLELNKEAFMVVSSIDRQNNLEFDEVAWIVAAASKMFEAGMNQFNHIAELYVDTVIIKVHRFFLMYNGLDAFMAMSTQNFSCSNQAVAINCKILRYPVNSVH